MVGTYTLPGVLLSDPHASRPAASDVADGTLYAETDTGQTYQSDGVSTWTAWGMAAGGTPATYHGCRVYNSAVQSINDSSAMALTFDTEELDTDAYHSTGANTSRFTVPSAALAGWYRLRYRTRVEGNTSGIRVFFAAADGSGTGITGSAVITQNPLAADFTMQGDCMVYLDNGHYVEVKMWQTSGSAKNFGFAYASDPGFCSMVEFELAG